MLKEWFVAASQGDVEAVRCLLKPNPWLANATDEQGNGALHRAIAGRGEPLTEGHRRVIRLVLGAGAELEARGSSPEIGRATPLILAASGGADRAEEVLLLLIHGARPDVVSSLGLSPLAAALEHRQWQLADALIAAGARVTLHDAVALDDLARATAMLEAAPTLANERDTFLGFTPLAFARSDGMRTLLTVHGAQPGLIEASHLGLTERVRQILDADAGAMLTMDFRHGTPLLVAARQGHLAVVQLLVERGADVDASWVADTSPLQVAQQQGHGPVVELLLAHGAH